MGQSPKALPNALSSEYRIGLFHRLRVPHPRLFTKSIKFSHLLTARTKSRGIRNRACANFARNAPAHIANIWLQILAADGPADPVLLNETAITDATARTLPIATARPHLILLVDPDMFSLHI